MPYQTGRNGQVAYALESTYGVPPAQGAASRLLRLNSGSLALSKEAIRSGENRRDGMTTRGRHGSRSVSGAYPCDLSLGHANDWRQAAFRGTFDAGLSLTGLSLTADATAKTFTRGSGSWIADLVRVGDVVRFGGFTTTANNARNFRVVGLTATVMTVGEAPAAVGTAQTGVTLTRSPKLIQGVVPRSFTVDEAELDIGGSELFSGVRVTQYGLSLQPNGMAVETFTLMGQNMDVKDTGGTSPWFTAPVTTTAVGLTSVEAVIRLGSTDVIDVTALDLTINLNGSVQPVVGSPLTPDVFTNPAVVEGSITALRSDLSRVKSFLSEELLSVHLLFAENVPEPKGFCSFYLGNLSLSGATKSELGSDGPRTQQLPLMIGADDRGGAFDPTMVKFQTSAP